MFTILKDKQFRATHSVLPCDGDAPIMFDQNRPYLSPDGRTRGYYVSDTTSCVFELDIICEALEQGFATKGYVTLELIN